MCIPYCIIYYPLLIKGRNYPCKIHSINSSNDLGHCACRFTLTNEYSAYCKVRIDIVFFFFFFFLKHSVAIQNSEYISTIRRQDVTRDDFFGIFTHILQDNNFTDTGAIILFLVPVKQSWRIWVKIHEEHCKWYSQNTTYHNKTMCMSYRIFWVVWWVINAS